MAKEEKKVKSDKRGIAYARGKANKIREGLVTSGNDAPTVKKVPTGLEELDHILSGGFPVARLTQIAGPDKTGKTTICYHTTSTTQQKNPGKVVLFVDTEGTFDPERAGLFGVDLDYLDICRPESAEEAFSTIRQYLLTDCPLIILDSVPMCFPEKVMEGDVGNIEVAPVARFLTLELPKLIPYLKRSDAVLLFVNQLREKIGGMPGWGDNTQLPGGRQLRHASSLILKLGRKQAIKVSDDEVGQFVKVKVEQTKVGVPKKECIVNLIYERGFVDNDNLESVKKEVHKINMEIEKARGSERKEEEDDGDSEE